MVRMQVHELYDAKVVYVAFFYEHVWGRVIFELSS